ncbi:hypothetical protein AB0D86_40855 [Streptomyces sp. NPDC048324]|uniref:hypothetical protein n=1 Tax=Streptomyces sp. NPDC048324 TaxID=3157205 RepID=UPI0034340AC1
MATITSVQPQVCNHRVLEVVTAVLFAAVVALGATLVLFTQKTGGVVVFTASTTLFFSVFGVGMGVIKYVKHGN